MDTHLFSTFLLLDVATFPWGHVPSVQTVKRCFHINVKWAFWRGSVGLVHWGRSGDVWNGNLWPENWVFLSFLVLDGPFKSLLWDRTRGKKSSLATKHQDLPNRSDPFMSRLQLRLCKKRKTKNSFFHNVTVTLGVHQGAPRAAPPPVCSLTSSHTHTFTILNLRKRTKVKFFILKIYFNTTAAYKY